VHLGLSAIGRQLTPHALVGPPGRVAEQLVAWRQCPIDTLTEPTRDDAIVTLAELW
jgi:hypothetical protein